MKSSPPRDRYGRPLPRGSRDELAQRKNPDDLAGGVALFNEQRFFEAHEFFEDTWNAADDRDRDFWKGVTQVAVGCCHAQRENRRGAVTLLERAVGYLRSFPSPHHGIDTRALISVAQTVADQVRLHGASADLDFPGFPTAP
jgi:predicted metal-dependent hydrolase